MMIVVGTDGSSAARAAVEWAVDDAARTRLPLRIVHAVEKPHTAVGHDGRLRVAGKALDEAQACARGRRPEVEVTCRLIEGGPATVLREQAKEADEIVIGSRGLGGFAGALLGSVSSQVAGQARCPVVVVRAGRGPASGEIVVGVADTADCEPALGYAFEQTRLRGGTLRAVHAWRPDVYPFAPDVSFDMDEVRTAQQKVITGRLAAFRQEYPDVEVIEDIRSAHPVDALTAASGTADLLVVGSHGGDATGSALLGSVGRGVLHHARCTVAVVRARE